MYAIKPAWAVMQERALIWFAGFGIVDALMLLAAVTAWTFAAERMYLVDAILNRSPARASVTRWFAKALSYRRQSIPSIAGATLAPTYLATIQSQLGVIMQVRPTSFLMVSWTGFIGGNVLYWLWVTANVPKRLQRCPQLSLRWHDPASTPGLRLLADGYFLSALFLLAGVIAISVLGFWLPRTIDVPVLLWLLYWFFALSVLTSLRITVVPFYWIWLIITRAKVRTLNHIAAQLDFPKLYTSAKLPTTVRELIIVYQAIAASQNLPFRTSTMVQYQTALAGSVVAFVISQFMSPGVS
ncbi:MAG: hypothetical protein JO115_13085 [Pseudonocardiales bacterium]|nr:hypothetical protein [Pseudonocardiales bacterium]